MPVSEAIPYSWYDTPNIHHTTLTDFRDFCADCGAVIEQEIAFVGGEHGRPRVVRWAPNLLADEAVFVLRCTLLASLASISQRAEGPGGLMPPGPSFTP